VTFNKLGDLAETHLKGPVEIQGNNHPIEGEPLAGLKIDHVGFLNISA